MQALGWSSRRYGTPFEKGAKLIKGWSQEQIGSKRKGNLAIKCP